jgi:hypothetical protein
MLLVYFPTVGSTARPLVISLLESLYVTTNKSFGYCCGVEWSDNGYSYAIDCAGEISCVLEHEIITSEQIQSVSVESPIFIVGELVKFRFAADGSNRRTVFGIQLINGA